jgi:TolB-like protein
MRPILLSALLALAPFAGASALESKTPSPGPAEPLLAVMDILNNTGELQSFVEGMPDMLITELMETGDVKLVERTKVQTAMKALKLETSGLTQERNLELGKWLGVDGILFGAFNRVGDKYRLDVRAIDVQTGKINVAASATCDKQNVAQIIPDIGGQLRLKLARSAPPGPGQPPVTLTLPPAHASVDSGSVEIAYTMTVALFAEAGIPHQRVRMYLDGKPWRISGVVNEINRRFVLCDARVPAGDHVVTLVHGTVDREGRWVRELESQPKTLSFSARKDERLVARYRMRAHDNHDSFSDFDFNQNPHNDGE